MIHRKSASTSSKDNGAPETLANFVVISPSAASFAEKGKPRAWARLQTSEEGIMRYGPQDCERHGKSARHSGVVTRSAVRDRTNETNTEQARHMPFNENSIQSVCLE